MGSLLALLLQDRHFHIDPDYMAGTKNNKGDNNHWSKKSW